MSNLNDLNRISELDENNMADIISYFPKQIEKGWIESQKLIIPSYYLKVNKVVIVGMGGSGISGALVRSLLYSENEIPVIVHRDYGIPGCVDEKTLVIANSYSGDTEETLDSFVAAYSKGAKLIAICTGGKLESLAKKYKAPMYKFDYPAEPRSTLGFSLAAILGIFKKIGISDQISQKDINESINVIKKFNESWKPETPIRKNYAKKIANNIFENIPVIWASGILEDVARRWKCQFNENAKNSSFFEVLPELNHNTISDLNFPKLKNLYILILQSKYYHPRNNKRIEISQDILNKKEIPNLIINLDNAGGSLSEMLSFVFLGDFVSFYLAILHGVNPTKIDIIKYLKKRLNE